MGPAPTHLDELFKWTCGSVGESAVSQQGIEAGLLHEPFDRQAVVRPQAPAIVSSSAHYTYAELQDATNALAVCLQKRLTPHRHVRRGHVIIALCFEHSALAIIGMLAIVKAGAAVLPLAPKDSNSRLQALIEHSECSLIVASPIQATRIKGLDLCKQSAGIQIMQIDADAIADCCRARRMPHSSSYAPIAPTLPSDLAYVLFTSGTSLHSKGMMVSHGAATAAIAALATRWGLDACSRRLQYTEYTFDNSIQDVFGTLSAGGCIVVPSDAERANNLLEFCEVHHVNALHITPTVLRLHFAQPSTTSIQLKSLVIGGEPVRDHDLDILRQWAALCKDLRAFVAYGSTETCIDCIARQVTSSEALAPVNSIGSPISFLIWQTWLVSPLTQRLAPVGAQAELYVGGPAVARGYLPSNEVSQTGFLGFQDPFYGKSVNVEPKDQQPHIRFPHP